MTTRLRLFQTLQAATKRVDAAAALSTNLEERAVMELRERDRIAALYRRGQATDQVLYD